jgi:ABC-type uncharacterized transport system substrate-binding protein
VPTRVTTTLQLSSDSGHGGGQVHVYGRKQPAQLKKRKDRLDRGHLKRGTAPLLAAKAATATIPIVFLTGGDPVEAGHVASFNRPGGNVTGIAFMNVALTGRRIDLLHKLVPAALRFALLLNPNDARNQISDAQEAAAAIGRQIANPTSAAFPLVYAKRHVHTGQADRLFGSD